MLFIYYVYIHTCACTSQRSTLGVLFYCLPPSLRQNLSLTLELTKIMSRLASQQGPEISLSCLVSSLPAMGTQIHVLGC